MSDLTDAIKSELDLLENRAKSVVDKIKFNAHRRPWPFVVVALVLGFILGQVAP